jgi:hypothetical protein
MYVIKSRQYGIRQYGIRQSGIRQSGTNSSYAPKCPLNNGVSIVQTLKHFNNVICVYTFYYGT